MWTLPLNLSYLKDQLIIAISKNLRINIMEHLARITLADIW